MGFKVGDRVKRARCGSNDGFNTGDVGTVFLIEDGNGHINVQLDRGCVSEGNDPDNLDLISSGESNSSLKKTMEKQVYKVLIVNKKTKKVEKNEVVVAEDEQQAILKAFGVDSDNAFIKVSKEGSFIEDKPVQAIIVKTDKK